MEAVEKLHRVMERNGLEPYAHGQSLFGGPVQAVEDAADPRPSGEIESHEGAFMQQEHPALSDHPDDLAEICAPAVRAPQNGASFDSAISIDDDLFRDLDTGQGGAFGHLDLTLGESFDDLLHQNGGSASTLTGELVQCAPKASNFCGTDEQLLKHFQNDPDLAQYTVQASTESEPDPDASAFHDVDDKSSLRSLHSEKQESEDVNVHDHTEHRYGLRSSPRDRGTVHVTTWVDRDTSGNYGEKPSPFEEKKRKRAIVQRVREPGEEAEGSASKRLKLSNLAARQKGASMIITIELKSAAAKALAARIPDNWPDEYWNVLEDGRIHTVIEDMEIDERTDQFNGNRHHLRARN
ncbi:hypothetical protein LTS18_003790, partial [Coniosporium uncinatum]